MATVTMDLGSLDGSNGFRLDGVPGGGLGKAVSNAGDVNGDGIDDVILSAPYALTGGPYDGSGFSYVVFGKTTGFDATLDVSTLNGSNGFRLTGIEGYDFGSAVGSAGDVNGDGLDDLLIGAPFANKDRPTSLGTGSSFIVFGKASGFNADVDVSNLDGNNGFRINGLREFDKIGASVSGAGDVNGDGFDDVIVGGPNFDPNNSIYEGGASFVVFGKSSGFDAVMDGSRLDGSNGFLINGRKESDHVGSDVSSAGDVNGDGFGDVIIDAKDSLYLLFGKGSDSDATFDLSSLDGTNGFNIEGDSRVNSVSTAGDFNSDGFDDVIVGAFNSSSLGSTYVIFGRASGFDPTLNLSSLDGSNGFRLNGENISDYSGSSVSNAGDVNGDGFDDLIIGAVSADFDGSNSGSSYILFGKASGFEATMNLSDLDSNAGFRIDGAGTGDFSGSSVSGAGDVNDDGYDDLIIGAPGANSDGTGTGSGASYIIFGRSDFNGGGLSVIPGTPDDDVLRGTSAAEIFEAGDGNDMMIGRGGADVFHGGAGVDQIKVPDLNFALIDGGAGTDILHLDGKDLHLDLASIGDKIQGIETICIYGRGDNTLSLTADSVLNLSDTSNTLKLHGNAGDLVTVQDNGWVDGGVKGFYHTYTNDDAVLLVGANLAIDFIA
ncbi:MAG: FG-GAP repeat protein [Nitrosomonas sp.]|nr:FG-GAP repeat protein [Nitrosomonas sp.]